MFWLKLEKNKQFNNINTIEFKTIDKQMYKGIIIIDFQTYSLKTVYHCSLTKSCSECKHNH